MGKSAMEHVSISDRIKTPEDELDFYYVSLQVCFLTILLKSKSINLTQAAFFIDLMRPSMPDLSEKSIADNIVSMMIHIQEDNCYMGLIQVIGTAKILPDHYKTSIIENTLILKYLNDGSKDKLIDVEIIADDIGVKGYKAFRQLLDNSKTRAELMRASC